MSYKILATSRGKKFYVDTDDYEKVSRHGWCENGNGYLVANIKGKTVRLHRFVTGVSDPKIIIDHINGDKSDCRKSNLRKTNHTGNNRNCSKNKNNKSGYKGIFPHGKHGWRARITVNYKAINLGTFKSKRHAIIAYDNAAKLYHGEFAKLNGVTK